MKNAEWRTANEGNEATRQPGRQLPRRGRRLRPCSAGNPRAASPAPEAKPPARRSGRSEMGNFAKLCGVKSAEKTVSKLRSAPAPYLAQAPAPKLGVGVDLNRSRVRVGGLLGPDTVLTRSRPHRGPDPTSPRCGPDLTETRTRSHRDADPTRAGPRCNNEVRGVTTKFREGRTWQHSRENRAPTHPLFLGSECRPARH